MLSLDRLGLLCVLTLFIITAPPGVGAVTGCPGDIDAVESACLNDPDDNVQCCAPPGVGSCSAGYTYSQGSANKCGSNRGPSGSYATCCTAAAAQNSKHKIKVGTPLQIESCQRLNSFF